MDALAKAQYDPAEQPFLFSPEIVQELHLAEEHGEFTAQRFKLIHPHKYQAIVTLRGWNWGQKRIAKLLHVHDRTIAAVDQAEAEPIETLRGRLAKNLRRAASLQVDRLLEHPDSVPMQFAAVVANTLINSSELLEGRATARVEHVEALRFDDWGEFVEKHLGPDEVREIEGPAIGSTGEKTAPVTAPAPDPAAAPPDGQDVAGTPGADGESDGKGDSPQVNEPMSRPSVTDPGPDPGEREAGTRGGGASTSRERAGLATDNVRRKISDDNCPF